jgi:signal transduction histidine kinase
MEAHILETDRARQEAPAGAPTGSTADLDAIDRPFRLRVAFQVVAVLLTSVGFAVMWWFDLLGPIPLWELLGLLVVASLISQAATTRWGAGCSRRQLHQRIAVHVAMTTVIIYAIGWGPTLAVGYLVSVTGDLEISGSAAARPSLMWGTAGISAGQAAIALGLVSTQIDEPLVHGVGALSALGLAFVVYLLGAKTKEIETADAELRGAAADLMVANTAMREFVAIASHELRTPTTVVKGFASTMQSHWDSIEESDRRTYLDAIVRSADHLAHLVDDLLTVSKIDAGVVETHAEAVPVECNIHRALEDLGYTTDFVVCVPPNLAICADPEHLRRILRNYIENAVHYGAPPFVVEVTCVDEHAELRVRDQGEGLPAEFLPRAFEKFAQALHVPGAERKGTGLGLSIVRGLARAGGGDAWYEPNQPNGSCFAASFPLA